MSGNQRNQKKKPRFRKPRGKKNVNGKGVSPENTTGTSLSAGFRIRNLPFFGYKMRKNLNYYSSGVVISGASGAASAYVFSANGLFDPDITGTGTQPISFDEAMSFFNHYTVHRARIRVTFSSDSTTLRATCGLFVSGSSTVTTSVPQLLENGDGAVQQLQYAGAMGSSATFSRSINVGRFQAVANVMDDPNMRGDSASNPTEQVYFHLIVYNATTAAGVQCEWMCSIDYDATFHEPRKGAVSISRGGTVVETKHPGGEPEIIYLPGNRVVNPNVYGSVGGRPQFCNTPDCRFFGTNAPHERCATASNQTSFDVVRVSQTRCSV